MAHFKIYLKYKYEQFKNAKFDVRRAVRIFFNPRTFVPIFMMLGLIFYLQEKYINSLVSFLFTIGYWVWWDYNRGYHIHWYRMQYMRRLENGRRDNNRVE